VLLREARTVSLPPISQTPLSDAGVNGVVTAGKEVGDSCHCEERSAEVAEYEESANAVPRQSSARMPKRRSKCRTGRTWAKRTGRRQRRRW
jgi:hypothetical protein